MHETLLNRSILEANKPIIYCIWVVLSNDRSHLFADFFFCGDTVAVAVQHFSDNFPIAK